MLKFSGDDFWFLINEWLHFLVSIFIWFDPGEDGEGKEDQAERDISATELNMLPCVYPWSINVVVYHDPSGRIHLGMGLALRCFQRLSLPNIATQRCR